MIKNEQELRDFLKEYPFPMVDAVSTIEEGYVSCIRPVPSICSAEVHCSPATYGEVRQLIAQTKPEAKGDE